jgi:glucan phosphoethanolaminetransferase (alkaline phosphatase superfamily)
MLPISIGISTSNHGTHEIKRNQSNNMVPIAFALTVVLQFWTLFLVAKLPRSYNKLSNLTTPNEYVYNNNNQAFYSQASWGRLEMKPHGLKKQRQNKSEKRRGMKTKDDKKTKSKKEKRQ